MFVAQPGKKCCICGKEAPAFYAGHAYTKDEKYITFLFDEEKFCADCLENGDAARQLTITFQLPYINGFATIPQKYRDAVLKKTPSCSADFALYHEVHGQPAVMIFAAIKGLPITPPLLLHVDIVEKKSVCAQIRKVLTKRKILRMRTSKK